MELVEYTDWERLQWHRWIIQQQTNVLELAAGPHGDGRFETVGQIMRHIFSAQMRYVERLIERPLRDFSNIPAHDADAVFALGESSRKELKTYVAGVTEQDWDQPRRFRLLDFAISATPQKVIMHVLLHEIRHWAQIATIFRLAGLRFEGHDLILSPVMGDPMREQMYD